MDQEWVARTCSIMTGASSALCGGAVSAFQRIEIVTCAGDTQVTRHLLPPTSASMSCGVRRGAQPEVPCHDMPNKVVPFPIRSAPVASPITCHSRVHLRVGRQDYAIDVTAQASPLPAERTSPVQKLQIETRFLHLRQPAALGDRIEGGRVCWLGGWDKGQVFFVVMVERVIARPNR
jgi:hypothetical protein